MYGRGRGEGWSGRNGGGEFDLSQCCRRQGYVSGRVKFRGNEISVEGWRGGVACEFPPSILEWEATYVLLRFSESPVATVSSLERASSQSKKPSQSSVSDCGS